MCKEMRSRLIEQEEGSATMMFPKLFLRDAGCDRRSRIRQCSKLDQDLLQMERQQGQKDENGSRTADGLGRGLDRAPGRARASSLA
jgi:hypothetical protein